MPKARVKNIWKGAGFQLKYCLRCNRRRRREKLPWEGSEGGGPGSPQKIGSRQIQACLVYIRSHSIVRDDILVSLAIRNFLWILQCYSHNVVYGALFAWILPFQWFYVGPRICAYIVFFLQEKLGSSHDKVDTISDNVFLSDDSCPIYPNLSESIREVIKLIY